ncbi:MAG: hypothetical protein ABSF53_05900 [Terracidiphilus sp.]|jgi:hypothetical protein
MLILRALQWEEQHGYGISQAIRAISGDVVQSLMQDVRHALRQLRNSSGFRLTAEILKGVLL